MQQVRRVEQRKAAFVGEYACQVQLGFTSAQVKNRCEQAIVEDLKQILRVARPNAGYTERPAGSPLAGVAGGGQQ